MSLHVNNSGTVCHHTEINLRAEPGTREVVRTSYSNDVFGEVMVWIHDESETNGTKVNQSVCITARDRDQVQTLAQGLKEAAIDYQATGTLVHAEHIRDEPLAQIYLILVKRGKEYVVSQYRTGEKEWMQGIYCTSLKQAFTVFADRLKLQPESVS